MLVCLFVLFFFPAMQPGCVAVNFSSRDRIHQEHMEGMHLSLRWNIERVFKLKVHKSTLELFKQDNAA